MSARSIGFIGGGRVTRILLEGWARAGKLPERIVVSDLEAESLQRLSDTSPHIRFAAGKNTEAAGQDVVFLAVHPPVVSDVLASVKGNLQPDAILVSLAPKFTIARLQTLLDGFARIARMIPNAPSIIGKGFNPISCGASLTEQDRIALFELMSGLGQTPEVAEKELEVYAVLTAMGPTYLWPQLYQLQALAESFGLDSTEAWEALLAMVHGTLATMTDAGLSGEQVQDLIPVKPLGDDQASWLDTYRTRLTAFLEKIRP